MLSLTDKQRKKRQGRWKYLGLIRDLWRTFESKQIPCFQEAPSLFDSMTLGHILLNPTGSRWQPSSQVCITQTDECFLEGYLCVRLAVSQKNLNNPNKTFSTFLSPWKCMWLSFLPGTDPSPVISLPKTSPLWTRASACNPSCPVLPALKGFLRPLYLSPPPFSVLLCLTPSLHTYLFLAWIFSRFLVFCLFVFEWEVGGCKVSNRWTKSGSLMCWSCRAQKKKMTPINYLSIIIRISH